MPNYNGRAVFVGNLPESVRERELEDLFYKFGRIVNVDIKRPHRPPFFAFVEFEDERDAAEAARRRDGVDLHGARIRVEVAKGGDVRSNHRPVNARSTGYRVIIRNLPKSASWQDLKDHFRSIVKPVYTEVQHDRDGPYGIAEFETYDDMKLAIRKCDDTEFKNPFDKGTYIRVEEANRDGGRGGGRDRDRDSGRNRDRDRDRDDRRERDRRDRRSRSRSPARRSRSRSPAAAKSRSRSPSKSPARSRSRSPAKSDDDRRRSRSPPDHSPARSD